MSFLLLTYVENTFIGSGKCGGVKTEEALAEELMILGVFLQQVDPTFGDAVLNLGLRVFGTPPHHTGPEVDVHLRNSFFQVCNRIPCDRSQVALPEVGYYYICER